MIKVAVFISGGGTTLKNLIACQNAGTIPMQIELVISSNPLAGGLRFAEEARIPSIVVSKRLTLGDADSYSHAMFQPCREAGIDLVVMGGFLKHVLIPEDFQGKVINIHPSLIPAFCGHRMYGRHVHEAALHYGVKVSGCTVHFVDNHFDNGPIILQRTCPVMDDDTPDTLAKRVFIEECEALPEAIRMFAAGELIIQGRRVVGGQHLA